MALTRVNDGEARLARLLEESGELANQIHQHEGAGVEPEKHSEPDESKLAKEIQQVLTAVLDIARHYGIEDMLKRTVEASYPRAVREGLIAPLSDDG